MLPLKVAANSFSLFERIPENRTCDDAAIPGPSFDHSFEESVLHFVSRIDRYCICEGQGWNEIPLEEAIYKFGVKAAIDETLRYELLTANSPLLSRPD